MRTLKIIAGFHCYLTDVHDNAANCRDCPGILTEKKDICSRLKLFKAFLETELKGWLHGSLDKNN